MLDFITQLMLYFVAQLTRDATRLTPADHERLRAIDFDDPGHPPHHSARFVGQSYRLSPIMVVM